MHPTNETINEYVDGVLSAEIYTEVEHHLQTCAQCTLFVAELQHVIGEAASLPPVEPPAYIWARLESRLGEAPVATSGAGGEGQWAKGRNWRPVWAWATAALVVLAFLAGRVIEQRQQRSQVELAGSNNAAGAPNILPSNTSTDAANVRERVLLVAVGDHLERSQMVLVELANTQTQGELDISAERQWADELLASNRLYRQTAVQLGQTNVASVLDDLERVLVEVARGPSQVSMQQLAEIQQRIEAQGILFKVKIIGSEMRERGNSTLTGRKQPVS